MAQIKQPVGRIVAKFKAAVFVSRRKMRHRLRPSLPSASLFRSSFYMLAVGALSLNILTTAYRL
jgi:hypothetical protein